MSDLTPTQKGILRTLSKIKDEIYEVLGLDLSPDYYSADDFLIACEDCFFDTHLVMDTLMQVGGCSGIDEDQRSLFNFIIYNCVHDEALIHKYVQVELVKDLSVLKYSRPTDQLDYEARLLTRLGL